MLSGVSTICFAASYAVALALEASRLAFRSRVRGAAMLGFAAAGLAAHTAFLYYRAVGAAGAPLSSEKDWYLLAAWGLAAVYLYLAVAHPKVPFGLFLLPLALAMIGAAAFLASDQPLELGAASRVWGAIHNVSILLASVSVLVGFTAGLMYLGQARRLKQKHPATGGLRLPSLEWLQSANARAIVGSVFLLGVGVISGMILNRIRRDGEGAPLPLHDPVVLTTLLLFGWLSAAALLVRLHRRARQGRNVAYLTLASFVFLVLVLAAGLLLGSRHWQRGERGERREERGRNAECRRMNAEWQSVALRIAPSSFILHPSSFRVPGGPQC